MRVLVACEFSGAVREAFRRRGHEAYSCDLIPAEDDSPHHFRADALEIAYGLKWDLMLAFPPCDHLARSGGRWFPEKRASGAQQAAIDFFKALALAPIARIAIENPIGIMSSVWRAPDQIVQPWQFGHGETKATCLWLQGLPPLRATAYAAGRVPRVFMTPDRKSRKQDRSRTLPGIAEAMAAQWGDYSDLVQQMQAA